MYFFYHRSAELAPADTAGNRKSIVQITRGLFARHRRYKNLADSRFVAQGSGQFRYGVRQLRFTEENKAFNVTTAAGRLRILENIS